MKKMVLFGAGQAGRAAARLIGSDWEICCFADNAAGRLPERVLGLEVLPPAEALEHAPDAVCLCAADAGRAGEMAAQLRGLGYTGQILDCASLRLFDARLAVMRLLAEQLKSLGIPGDAAELGVYRGCFAAQINAALPERTLHLFDTFRGFDARDIGPEAGLSRAAAGDFADTSVEAVRSILPHAERAVFHAGYFPETFEPCEGLRFALVSLDADLYAPTAAALPLFWERLSPGGAIIVHDVYGTQYPGAGRALDEFCRGRGVFAVPVGDLHGSAVLRKNR